MKYLTLFIMFFLAACSGGSGGGSDDNSVDVLSDSAERLRGPENEPTLKTVAFVNNLQPIDLNSLIQGFIGDSEVASVSFTSPSDGVVAFTLSSDAEDLDLWVYDLTDGGSFANWFFNSNEALVLEVKAGNEYQIEVEAWVGSGDFSLKVVEANRESLSLADSEFYIVPTRSGGQGECTGDNGEVLSFDAGDFSLSNQYIHNITSGEVRYFGESIDFQLEENGAKVDFGEEGYLLYQYTDDQGFFGKDYYHWEFEEGGVLFECDETIEFKQHIVI